MNALTWNFIVLLLIARRLIGLGGSGIFSLWNHLFGAAERVRPRSLLRGPRLSGWFLSNSDGGWIEGTRPCRIQVGLGVLEERLLEIIANYQRLGSLRSGGIDLAGRAVVGRK
jgi:hypothetical protein